MIIDSHHHLFWEGSSARYSKFAFCDLSRIVYEGVAISHQLGQAFMVSLVDSIIESQSSQKRAQVS